MTGSSADFLDRLDAAIGCQQCGGPLGSSPSDDFCDDDCQARWHAQHADRLTGYREPWHDPFGGLPGVGSEAMTWAPPVVWCLPRQTGDLDVDESALKAARRYADTAAQHAACRLRGQQLDRRRLDEAAAEMAERLRNWRLPRQTGNLTADRLALRRADIHGLSPARRAAVRLRRQQIRDREAEQLRASWEHVGRQFQQIGRAASTAFQQLAEAFSAGFGSRNVVQAPRRNGRATLARAAAHIHGQQVTWSEMDEMQRLWTTQNCGAVHRYEVDHADPREPTAQDRALAARRNRNTGPPAGRMDGRRGRGGPRR